MLSALWHSAIILQAPKVHRRRTMNDAYWVLHWAFLKIYHLQTSQEQVWIILSFFFLFIFIFFMWRPCCNFLFFKYSPRSINAFGMKSGVLYCFKILCTYFLFLFIFNHSLIIFYIKNINNVNTATSMTIPTTITSFCNFNSIILSCCFAFFNQ